MRTIIIRIDAEEDEVSDAQAVEFVQQVVAFGKISERKHGKQYCFRTTIFNATPGKNNGVHVTTKTLRKPDAAHSFTVYTTKVTDHDNN